MSLRPSRAEDLPFIVELERDASNKDFIGRWTEEEHLAAIADGNRREHWIIECEGLPAGYLIAYDCRSADAGYYVKRLVVGDKGRGIGSAAVREFNGRAMAMKGVSCVWLLVREQNPRAQHVYAKLGYRRFDPPAAEAARYDAAAEPPVPGSFRMRLTRT